MAEEDYKRRHQSTFLRQVLYTSLMIVLMTGLAEFLIDFSNFLSTRLTGFTVNQMNGQTTLPVTNIHGQEYNIKRHFLGKVIAVAWLIQVFAILINLGGYLIHPMAVEKSFKSKLFVFVFGKKGNFLFRVKIVLLKIDSSSERQPREG